MLGHATILPRSPAPQDRRGRAAQDAATAFVFAAMLVGIIFGQPSGDEMARRAALMTQG